MNFENTEENQFINNGISELIEKGEEIPGKSKYSKKELLDLLESIEQKVDNSQDYNVKNKNNNANSIKISNNEKKISLEDIKKINVEDLNIEDTYNKIKKEVPKNTMFSFSDGTTVRLTHPYSFSSSQDHSNILQESTTLENLKNTKPIINDKKDEKEEEESTNYQNINKNSNIYLQEKNKIKNEPIINTTIPKENDQELNNYLNKNFTAKEDVNIEKLSKKLKEVLFELKIFLMLFLFRFYNSISIRTFFVPDEYWQSIEIAHNYVFNYGYLTWEWTNKIRGFSYPLLFVPVYELLKKLNIDNTELIIFLPRVIHIFLAALCDLYTYKFTKKYFGRSSAKWALMCSLLSWTNWFILTRTISNTVETSLTIIALYYWPLEKKSNNIINMNSFRMSLIFAAISCILRPTNGAFWIFPGIYLIFQYRKSFKTLMKIMINVMIIMASSLFLSIYIDKLYYNEWVFVPWNFIKFNIIQNISIFYGDHSLYWYFVCGLPIIGYSFLLLTIPGIKKSSFHLPAYIIFWTASIYSIFTHKEFRFIYQITPLIFFYAGYYLNIISQNDKKIKSFMNKKKWKVISILVLSNVPLALYASMIFQPGVIDVMGYLRKEARADRVESILYMMPCHSTPYYSYIHKNIPMDFLTCEPPLGVKDIKSYKTQADHFYDDPEYYIFKTYSNKIGNSTITYPNLNLDLKKMENEQNEQVSLSIDKKEWPSHIVFYESLYNDIKFIFEGSDYKEVARYFNSHFNEPQRRGDVIVYSNIKNGK